MYLEPSSHHGQTPVLGAAISHLSNPLAEDVEDLHDRIVAALSSHIMIWVATLDRCLSHSMKVGKGKRGSLEPWPEPMNQ